MSRRRPSFIGVFNKHVRIGCWIGGRDLAMRVHPTIGDERLAAFAKDFCRRLSNLERYGHLQRRFNAVTGIFEYARKETPPLVRNSWCPTPSNPDPVE